MAINKKLIHFNSKTNFENEVANNNILDTSIVFIKDTKEIWTHGQFYGGGSNNSTAAPGAIPIINHGTSDTTIELTPNVIHKWNEIDSLSITLPVDDSGVVNHYKIVFSISSESFSLQLPSYLKWPYNNTPLFEISKQYEISIEDDRIAFIEFQRSNDEGMFLNYIENDGIDYILTDYVMSDNDCGYAFKARVLYEKNTYNHLFGTSTTTANSGSPFGVYTTSSNTNITGVWDGAATTIKTNKNLNEDFELTVPKTALIKVCSYPLCIFARNEAGTPASSRSSYARIYYVRVLDVDGNPNLDLRPFKRNSDGAVGLFDVITKTFYPSANGSITGL